MIQGRKTLNGIEHQQRIITPTNQKIDFTLAYQGVATMVQSKQKFKKSIRIEYRNDPRSQDIEWHESKGYRSIYGHSISIV